MLYSKFTLFRTLDTSLPKKKNAFDSSSLKAPIYSISITLSQKTAASIWGLVALRLADEEFLPFDYLSYAYELQVCILSKGTIIRCSLTSKSKSYFDFSGKTK